MLFVLVFSLLNPLCIITTYGINITGSHIGPGKIFTTKLEEGNSVMYCIFIVLNTVHLF